MSRRADSRVPEVFRGDRPMVFGHRGARALGPENTLAAIEIGLASGADGIECDVQLARDGTVVVCHDLTLDRTTDAAGPVAALTAAELARVDAAWHFEADRGFPLRGQGIGVPALADVLRRWPSARVIVEMKGSDERLGPAAVEVVRDARAGGRVCLGGFHAGIVRAARAAGPELTTGACQPEVRGAIYRAWARWPLRWPGAYAAYQVPEAMDGTRVATRRFIAQARTEGRLVQVWTVNAPDDMTRLLDWGVQGLISDCPDVAVAVRDRWWEARRRTAAPARDVAHTGIRR